MTCTRRELDGGKSEGSSAKLPSFEWSGVRGFQRLDVKYMEGQYDE